MPVAKGPKFDLRSAVIFGGVAVLAAIVIGFFAIRLGQQSNTLVLGDVNFGQINVFNISTEIAENGPVLFGDIATGDRDIYVQHLGDSPGEGWFAFDARPIGEARECNAIWSVADRTFTNPCTNTVFGEDGEGLPQIPVFIDEVTLVIDINGIHTDEDFVGFTGG